MSEPVKHRDPGPPTWLEAADGFAMLLRDAAVRVRTTAEVLSDYPPPMRLDDPPSPERAGAAGAFSAATADWKHWNTYQRRYEAFMRVHPDMRNTLITVECRHKGECWVGDDDGFYRDPNPKPAVRQREPGEDDEAVA